MSQKDRQNPCSEEGVQLRESKGQHWLSCYASSLSQTTPTWCMTLTQHGIISVLGACSPRLSKSAFMAAKWIHFLDVFWRPVWILFDLSFWSACFWPSICAQIAGVESMETTTLKEKWSLTASTPEGKERPRSALHWGFCFGHLEFELLFLAVKVIDCMWLLH